MTIEGASVTDVRWLLACVGAFLLIAALGAVFAISPAFWLGVGVAVGAMSYRSRR